ncbi:MAG: hypothetical protein ACI4W6_01615 [Acutalibacteraceae bacterium]
MKKTLTVILSLVLVLCLFASCAKGDSSQWSSNVNETFSDVVVYKYGDTSSAQFDSNCNIKINDDNYDHFVKYIEDLKEAGFEYVEDGVIPENYNLSNGQASWRCTNGKVYLQLIYNASDSVNYDMFGCNLQIYGYDKIPESWKSSKKESDEEETSSEDTAETTAAKEEAETTEAE